jgi:hypothetical protein
MQPNVVYCSACDREVRVFFTTPSPSADVTRHVAPIGVCFDYSAAACTGSMCALFQVPPSEMLVKLKNTGARAPS